MFKRIYIIINPASGRVEPILSYINKAMQGLDVYWEIAITHQKYDAFAFTKEALHRNFDLIVVYGGDGTVMEAAQALFKRKTPLLILPGGTANIMAKELGIPQNSEEAVKLLRKNRTKLKIVDMVLMDKQPFLLRINIGILAEMVRSTDTKTKERFGRLAYSVSALKHMLNHNIYNFSINIDGKKVEETGAALMIANTGNIGIGDFSVLPHVKVADGYLDVILFKEVAVHSLANWIKSTFTQKKPYGSIKHWKGKKVSIDFSPKTEIICDDISMRVKTINAKVAPQSLTVVVP